MKRLAMLTAVAVLFSVAGLAQAHCGQCETDKAHATTSQSDQHQASVTTVASQTDCASCPAEKKAAGDCATCPAEKKAAGDCASCPASQQAMADGTACSAAKKAAGECGPCPAGGKAAFDMPKMSYRVGERHFADYHEAKAAAAEAQADMTFVVGENVYEDKLAAKAALAEVTEAKVLALIEAHPQAQEAVAATFASYKVGEQSICCEKMASMAAEKESKPMHYVIAGQETACPVTARLLTAQAKLRAAAAAAAMTSDTTDAEPAAAMDQPATGS